MAKKRHVVQYRDTKTGLLVSKATWKRSKAQGGKRYVRHKYVVVKRRKEKPPLPPRPPTGKVKTWFVTLAYVNLRGRRVFDFFVRAARREDVMKYVEQFARKHPRLTFSDTDPRSKSVIDYLAQFGWTQRSIDEIPPEEFDFYENQPEGFVDYQPARSRTVKAEPTAS